MSRTLVRSDEGEDLRVAQLVEEVHLRDGALPDVAFPCPDMYVVLKRYEWSTFGNDLLSERILKDLNLKLSGF